MASNAAQHIEEDQPRLALPFLMNDVDKEQCEQGVDRKWVSGCMLLRRTCRIGINYLHDSLLAEEKREEEKTCRWFRKEAWQLNNSCAFSADYTVTRKVVKTGTSRRLLVFFHRN